MQLTIYGEASQSIVKNINYNDPDLAKDLLSFLREAEIPIASSCSGSGICKLCNINDNIISCEITLKDFIKTYGHEIRIKYL